MSTMLVPTTILVTVGLNELGLIVKGKNPTMRPVIAGFILGIGLFALQGLDDRLGTMFCILLIVVALLDNGQPIFNMIGGTLK
jgi:hypothetical protein